MVMNSVTSTDDVSLDQEFRKQLYNAARKRGIIDQLKYKKGK